MTLIRKMVTSSWEKENVKEIDVFFIATKARHFKIPKYLSKEMNMNVIQKKRERVVFKLMSGNK